MKKYVASYKDLGFDETFVKEAKEQLKRFAKEIPFRREEEEAARKLEGFENTLKKDLENYKNEGNALYREGKIEEAKLKFKEGYELYKQDFRKIKKSADKKVLEEVHILFKKILSNLALCYYKQGEYKESIKYDTELLLAYPKFGKSIVRILKAYTKLKDNPNAVIYGEQFLELDKETRDKFKGTQDIVQEEEEEKEKEKNEEQEDKENKEEKNKNKEEETKKKFNKRK